MPATVTLFHPESPRRLTIPPEQVPGLLHADWRVAPEPADLDDVPENAAAAVKWVGDDPARAEAARIVELRRSTPRKSVTEHVDHVLIAATDDEDDASPGPEPEPEAATTDHPTPDPIQDHESGTPDQPQED